MRLWILPTYPGSGAPRQPRRAAKRQAGGKVGERKVKQTMRQLFKSAVKKRLATRMRLYADGVPMMEIPSSAGRTRRLEAGDEERLLAAAAELGDLFTHIRRSLCRRPTCGGAWTRCARPSSSAGRARGAKVVGIESARKPPREP